MRDKKLLWSFLFSAFLVFMLALYCFCLCECSTNWGDVKWNHQISCLGTLFGDPGYYSSPDGAETRDWNLPVVRGTYPDPGYIVDGAFS